MKTLVVGHRGSGKTKFVERVGTYIPGAAIFDLDAEVARLAGMSVGAAFTNLGEAAFRELERRALRELAERLRGSDEAWVAAGAGFEGDLPEGWRALWLSRPTDASGRVFLDRPRLDRELSPLQEFLGRKPARDARYAALASVRLELDEGFEEPSPEERAFVRGEIANVGGACTFVPEDARASDADARLMRLAATGPKFVELRDDLLTEAQLANAAELLPSKQILLSAREPRRAAETARLARAKNCALDWALELGPPPANAAPDFVSAHDPEGLARLLEGPPSAILKASPLIESFAELERWDRWRRQDPARRALMPRSTRGRWAWYRLATKADQPLNFWREGAGSAPDQPPLLRWLRSRGAGAGFGAVLGSPVAHSRTPAEQRAFAETLGQDAYAIDVLPEEWPENWPEEWDAGALAFLASLGLRWAAVTAPLKERALQACAELDEVARRLGAVNTLARTGARPHWKGTNTDATGFAEAWRAEARDVRPELTAIWGGGGVLAAIRSALPEARAFSARTGEERTPGENAPWSPEAVVWAIGRAKFERTLKWPPPEWAPRLIFDVNYSEDSPGREYAASIGARYVSGLAMFRAQAEAQRAFWRSAIGRDDVRRS